MAETNRAPTTSLSQLPPPPPPLPPQRTSVLQRFMGPLAFNRPQRNQANYQGNSVAQSNSASPKDVSQDPPHRRPPARNAVHRTGIPISAIDINDQSTHAILAGRDILKTVRVQDRAIVEDLNIRNAVTNYISTQHLRSEEVSKRREYLPAKDVRWSHGTYSHVIATAAQNGRIALYDATTLASSSLELAWLFNHVGQVNKLDFDPHKGYMLLSGSQDKYCKIWDIRDPRRPSGYNQYFVKAPIRDVRWSPTNAWDFALCTENGVVQKWDVRVPNQYLLSINAHSKSCYTIAWHPDGRHLASGGVDKLMRVWDMKSDLKGQKSVLQMRCPHSIMNLAWRPPTWSAEFAKRGSWQTCHIATSYTDEDPRVHVWDLRRPLLPFRELSHYETRPIDMLWANKDLLWTVGGAGMFVQSDMSYANQVEESLPPGAVEWCPDGSFFAVVENRTASRRSSQTEPSAVFLNVPQDSLGVEDGTTSRSFTDDETTDNSLFDQSRRQSRNTPSRIKSHPNTPPTHDKNSKVLPLDRTVMGKKEMFINGQVGALTCIPGVHIPVSTIDFVANNYARATTSRERAEKPEEILPRLQQTFLHNAKVCQAVEMWDVAQNWELMAEVIVPELKSWADNNRKRRLQVQEQAKKEEEARKASDSNVLSSLVKFAPKATDAKSPARSEKIATNLFRGVVESHRGSSDSGSHGGSNMTTPRQHPLPNSPATSKKDGNIWFTLDETIEPIQPLPPSLATAHSTAAVASRALLDNNSEPSNSPISSPERSRLSPERPKGHRRSVTESVHVKLGNANAKDSLKPMFQPLPPSRTQEDRRAALRDYKVLARQPFSLDAPIANSQQGREVRHDSSESFPMFSASGGSSARARSLGLSFDSPDTLDSPSRSRQDSSDWLPKEEYSESVTPSEQGQREASGKDSGDISGTELTDFVMDESPAVSFGLDGVSESKPVAAADTVTEKFKEALSRSPRSKEELEPVAQVNHDLSKLSTSEESKEIVRGFFARDHHLTNPFLDENVSIEKMDPIFEGDISLKSSYETSDFRPIDITKYEPCTLGFAVSTYPVLCSAIELDINTGPASSQFSAHLLSHVHPFFFHQSFRSRPTSADLANPPTSLAVRLMNPKYSARMIEGIFGTHMEYLRNLNLFIPAAEMRKLCVDDFEYPLLAGPEARTPSGSVGDQLKIDPLQLKWTCANCHNYLPTNATRCKICAQGVEACPICELSLTKAPGEYPASDSKVVPENTNLHMAVYCQACGHAAHLDCMLPWLQRPDVNGECPTEDCGCDCGPGLVRDQRIIQQMKANLESTNIRASTSSTVKRESKVSGDISTMTKARDEVWKRGSARSSFVGGDSLGRNSVPSDKTNTPSSAGTTGNASVWSKKGTSAGPGRMGVPTVGSSHSGGTSSAAGSTSFGRRVRVVEPEKD